MKIFVHIIFIIFLAVPILNYFYQAFKAIYQKSKGVIYFVDSTDKIKIVSFKSLIVKNTIFSICQIFLLLLYIYTNI